MNTLTPEQKLEGKAFTAYVDFLIESLGIPEQATKLLTILGDEIYADATQKSLYTAFSIGWALSAGVAKEDVLDCTVKDSASYAITLLEQGE